MLSAQLAGINTPYSYPESRAYHIMYPGMPAMPLFLQKPEAFLPSLQQKVMQWDVLPSEWDILVFSTVAKVLLFPS